jgi:hypothetical protein
MNALPHSQGKMNMWSLEADDDVSSVYSVKLHIAFILGIKYLHAYSFTVLAKRDSYITAPTSSTTALLFDSFRSHHIHKCNSRCDLIVY